MLGFRFFVQRRLYGGFTKSVSCICVFIVEKIDKRLIFSKFTSDWHGRKKAPVISRGF